jgi:predicted PurR-regulated permease PerM
MLLWTLQSIVISLILIVLIHYLFYFFKNTLTVPKVKDLVNKPRERYNEVISTLNNKKDIIPNKNDMDNELQNFLNDLKQNTSNNTLESASEANNVFSSY